VIRFDAEKQEYRAGEAWWADPFTFDQVHNCINEMFDHLRPKGRPTIPDRILKNPLLGRRWATVLGKQCALRAIADIELAMRRGGSQLTPPGFVDPFAASRFIKPTSSARDTLTKAWPAERKRFKAALRKIERATSRI
jgi:hypothetical protein